MSGHVRKGAGTIKSVGNFLLLRLWPVNKSIVALEESGGCDGGHPSRRQLGAASKTG